MPSRKLTGHCPKCHSKNHLRAAYCNQCGQRLSEQRAIKDDEGRAKLYADIAHPINSACREMIQQRVILAFQEEKSRAKLPGYVPSYDDFDQEETALVAAAAPAGRRDDPDPDGRETPRPPQIARRATPRSRPSPQRLRRRHLRSNCRTCKAETGNGDWLRRENARFAARNALPRRCLSPFLGRARRRC